VAPSKTRNTLIGACVVALVSACSAIPTTTTSKNNPTDGVAKVRAAIEAAVASSDLEIAKDSSSSTARRQSTVQCDTVGSMFICTDGQAICWWSRRTGYDCN